MPLLRYGNRVGEGRCACAPKKGSLLKIPRRGRYWSVFASIPVSARARWYRGVNYEYEGPSKGNGNRLNSAGLESSIVTHDPLKCDDIFGRIRVVLSGKVRRVYMMDSAISFAEKNESKERCIIHICMCIYIYIRVTI